MNLITLTLFTLVFAILFPIIGFFAGIAPLYEQGLNWWSSRSYVQVAARVGSTELEQRAGRKSGMTYLVKSSFSYESGRPPHRTARQLQRIAGQRVDISHPERSVFDRTIRWHLSLFHLPFAVLFPAIGLGARATIFHMWRPGRNRTMADTLREGQPPRLK